MLDIKLGSKQINNLHILFENLKKYDTRFNGYKLLPIYDTDKYEDFEKAVIKFMNERPYNGEYINALSYFGIYPDDNDRNVAVANQIIDIYGNELKDRPIVEVACGNFPALSRKIAQLYPEVSNIIVYDNDIVVDKYLDSSDVEQLDIMDIKKESFDSSKPIPYNSIIISRHPCTSTPAIIASRSINRKNDVDLYTVLCNCDNEYINTDIYDIDDQLIRPSVTSLYRNGTLDNYISQTLFAKKMVDKNGNSISWQDKLEGFYRDDPEYHFTSLVDPLTQENDKVMYTKKR